MEGNFQFAVGDVVLAEWTDKLFYAKILHIDRAQLTSTLLFDDDSVEECPISKIHSVTETTADIVCIICKDGSSCTPNVIVLCDKCGVGYHQKCHEPFIKDNALEPDAPWMCVYCSNGTDCPYLLNPFEAKMKHFTPSSRKQRELIKDNPYSADPKADFGNNNRSESARARMEDYYNDNHRHSEMSTSTSSVARHILGDRRHAISRRGMVADHRMPGHHGNRFYKFPKNYEASRERLHFHQMESDAKRRRVGADQPDNGVSEKVDPKNKAPGKEGPREKQRLTQDLERQRKKLKEDMERGQVLKREHSQLLTRDHSRVKNNNTTSSKEGKKEDLEETPKHGRTTYYPGQEWPDTYLVGKSSGRNPREVTESNEMSCDDARVGKKRSCNLNEDASLQQTRPATELDTKEPRIELDACGCTGSENHSGGSQREGTAKDNMDGTKEGVVEEISEMQCEHSMSSRNPHTGETIEFTFENISPPSSNARSDVMVEPREELTCGTGENINGVHERVFTSEKVEVIGRSDDLTSSSNHEKGRQYPKARPRKTQGKAASRPYKRGQKSLPEKDNHEITSEATDTGFNENGTTPKSKEGNRNVEGSGGFQRQSVSHSDNEVAETEDGEGKERSKTKSHHATGGNKNVDEVQNVITQNRVRSDLPRHNWLIERLRNEKKLPPGASSDGGLKEKKVTSEEGHVDSKLEVTSSTWPANAELKKPPVHSTTGHVPEEKPKDVQDGAESSCEEEARYSWDDKEQGEDGDEPGSPNFKILSPKSDRNSPANSLSPELKQYSPTLPPASPFEEEQEVQKGSSPLLKVPVVPGIILGEKRQSLSRESAKDNEIVVEENFSLDSLEGSDKTITRNERQSVQEIEEDNLQIVVDEKEKPERTEDEKIIEIKSDGEGHEDIKQSNDTNKERELSKIPTGKSVNPVSPFLRSERRSTEELKPDSHGSRHHGVVARSPRFPADLPSALPFMKPGYIPGYPPRTFTPHLITHNPGLSTVSPIPRHAGHLPIRMDLGGHSKSDHDCPYHGKKAAEKLTQHAPGYPMVHSDHHHLGRIPFHDSLPDFALHEKLREHVQLASDPTAFHRRLPSLYDSHRHFVMPHGMPGHVFPPGYLPPRLLDEHMLHLDRERFERRTFPLHEPPKHAYSGPSGEHQNAPKYVASPVPEKRNASKHAASPSAEHRNVSKHVASSSCDGEKEPTKTRNLHETTAGHYHSAHHPDMLHASRQRSPHELKYSSHSELNATVKSGNHSPFAIAQPAYTPPPPPSNETSGHRGSSFIQLGETKTTQAMTGSDKNLLAPSPSLAAHDQESIRRDFQEKLNKLNKKFIQGLDAMVKPEDERSYKTLDNNVPPTGYHKPGDEFLHRGVPVGYVADGITRPLVGENAFPLSREAGKSKYSNHDNRRTPAARSSSPGLHMSDRGEPDKRGFCTVSSHKPTLPTTSYRPHSNTAGLPRPHGVQFRDNMNKPPGMMHGLPHLTRHGEHPTYHDHVAWATRSRRPMAGYPSTRINPDAHQKTAMEKSEKGKVDHVPSKQELDEKEISLAREKHLINLTHLENERRKAMMGNAASRPRLPSRSDERPREERARPDKAEQGHLSPKSREDALHWDWEEAESRKRKYEEIRPEILAMHGRISPFGKISIDQNKRLKSAPIDGRIPGHTLLHQHINEDFNSRKDRYLSMYPHSDPYGHVTTVPYPGRARDVGNAPFYMGRFDLQRPKPEKSMELRKQREVSEEKISAEKQSSEKERSTSESAKKRPKPQKLCDICRKEASFLCSGCEKAWYCSTECQFKAWTEHSKECSQGKRR